eukprot:PLAT6141.1.p1 GENE.PLAT6141.1~~PLAT6141.1.p1  ORF type:complete len:450 (+),score=119.26 PLAT6141.1:26-1375(+)
MPSAAARWAAQAVFLATGIISTLVSQLLFYQGAADQRALLIPLCNYVGMAGVGLLPDGWLAAGGPAGAQKGDSLPAATARRRHIALMSPRRRGAAVVVRAPGRMDAQRRPLSLQACVILSMALDIGGSLAGSVGLGLAGSGLYQVIYSSVVCWAALLSRALLGKRLSGMEMISILIVTSGLSISAIGANSGGGSTADVLAGIFVTLLSALLYGGSYVLGEYMMALPGTPSPKLLCVRVGSYSLAVVGAYIVAYTIPNWHTLLGEPVQAAHGRLSSILLGYAAVVLSQLAHNVTYYMLLGSVGAVATGLLQAARAIGVFALSSALFCSAQASQCYTWQRAAATVVVVSGILLYSFAKAAKLAQKDVAAAAPSGSSIKDAVKDGEGRGGLAAAKLRVQARVQATVAIISRMMRSPSKARKKNDDEGSTSGDKRSYDGHSRGSEQLLPLTKV